MDVSFYIFEHEVELIIKSVNFNPYKGRYHIIKIDNINLKKKFYELSNFVKRRF